MEEAGWKARSGWKDVPKVVDARWTDKETFTVGKLCQDNMLDGQVGALQRLMMKRRSGATNSQ